MRSEVLAEEERVQEEAARAEFMHGERQPEGVTCEALIGPAIASTGGSRPRDARSARISREDVQSIKPPLGRPSKIG